jgi:hypothetical protein
MIDYLKGANKLKRKQSELRTERGQRKRKPEKHETNIWETRGVNHEEWTRTK